MTLHTAPGCSINSNSKMLGTVATSNCDINAPDQGTNVGCGIKAADTTTYGDGFNSAGGGVYATEWTTESISVYHFSRGSIPSDIASGKPDPTSWGRHWRNSAVATSKMPFATKPSSSTLPSADNGPASSPYGARTPYALKRQQRAKTT